jgi:hypothetical protein
MMADSVRERLGREPFQPFRICASSGKDILVAGPGLVVLMKSEVFVAAPNSDKWAQIPYLHIAGLEVATATRPRRDAGNGHPKRNGRRPRRG